MANGGDEQQLLWMKLPDWAEDLSDEGPVHFTQDMVDRFKLHLTPYDPNNKEKGRQVLIIDGEEIQKEVCMVCDRVNEHFSTRCPFGSLDELLLSKGVKKYCDWCRKKDAHFSWKCPNEEPRPFKPVVFKDPYCNDCGPDAKPHFSVDCPKLEIPLIQYEDCYICRTSGQHDTEECPTLINSGKKFCFRCMAVADHTGEACTKKAKRTDVEIEEEEEEEERRLWTRVWKNRVYKQFLLE